MAHSEATVEEKAPSTAPARDLDQLTIDTIRTLTIDAVEKAQSGHPGAPMAMAPVGYTLWNRFLVYDPDEPAWPNRDRFILSAGHACMLLYALLHLAGVRSLGKDGKAEEKPAVSLEDIKTFRELGSRCPGHPEYGHTTGVEITTGPLGQGAANSVGIAITQRWLAARYNQPDSILFDYNIYALCSDGDMMEGITSEAASLAGHLKLSNLCWIYDDNTVTIEGHTDLAFNEDIAERFHAYGWATHQVDDANDCEAFARALENFQATNDRPTLIVVKSVIGYGSPHVAGTSKAHSDPLGAEEIKLIKEAYGWPTDAHFLVPAGVKEHLTDSLKRRGGKARAHWDETWANRRADHSVIASELEALWAGDLPAEWEDAILTFPADAKGMASREACGKVLNALARRIPWLVGGSADLSPSTKTRLEFDAAGDFEPRTYGGRNFHFGVREHAMGAIANGMAASRLRPYTGTFLIFSDYMRPPTRLAALMELPAVFIFSHDSIGVGQDGPTHQPIEQLAALRAIPQMLVFRPADANETAQAWRAILAQNRRPACLITSRQALPTVDRAKYGAAEGVARGGYVLAGGESEPPEVILIGTGSEITLCLAAHERLEADGVRARVVSLPCWELFAEQDQAYRDSVLPPAVAARVGVEAAAPFGWERWTGLTGEVIAMRSFGASAPIAAVMPHFGFTVEHVLDAARRQIEAHRS